MSTIDGGHYRWWTLSASVSARQSGFSGRILPKGRFRKAALQVSHSDPCALLYEEWVGATFRKEGWKVVVPCVLVKVAEKRGSKLDYTEIPIRSKNARLRDLADSRTSLKDESSIKIE